MLCEASNTDVDSCLNHSGVVHLLPQSEPVNTEIELPYLHGQVGRSSAGRSIELPQPAITRTSSSSKY